MKNTVGIIITLLIVAGVGVFIVSQQPTPNPQPSNQNEISSIENSQTQISQTKSDSAYVYYSKPIFDEAINRRRVLFFYANWCPICKPADANFQENQGKIPSDVVLLRVNYNDTETDQEEKDLATKYGITYQHTFVQIDSQGNEVAKWNGGQIEELLANIK